jgi:DNA gyrase/topoisomerase IV subunit A
MNESLRAENLELGSGNRVKEYERRIAELEFQLELFKRQLDSGGGKPQLEATSLLLFNDKGQVIRLAIDDASLAGDQPFSRIEGTPHIQSHTFGLVTASAFDQFLLVFSTGRTTSLPVEQVPLSTGSGLAWASAYQADLRSMEELAWMLPITRLHAYDCCVQVSRFGSARKIGIGYFKTFITNNNIGKGVKFNFDRILNLTLCNENQLLVLASRTGNLLSLNASALPVALDEIMRFKVNDYVVSALTLDPGQSLVAVTQNGAAYAQNQAWLLPAKDGERRVRQLLPEKKREEDEVLAGAVALGDLDWLIVYRDDGILSAYRPASLSNRKTMLAAGQDARVLGVAVYSPSQTVEEEL